jgi:hypothetical protein
MQLTREFFDTLIVVVILIGLALAVVRLYADFTRPLPNAPDDEPDWARDDDTQPHKQNDDL